MMIRGNLGMAMQGLAVVPLFAGYDLLVDDPPRPAASSPTTSPAAATRSTRSTRSGSGSFFARGALKKLYRENFTAADAIRACVEALYDAADDDSATGGPDLTRRIYPLVSIVDVDGVHAGARRRDGRGRRARSSKAA